MGQGIIVAQSSWEQTDGPYGGEISSIVCFEDQIYATARNKGLYLSNNSGQNWGYIGLYDIYITGLATNCKDHIFVGTAENGLFFSTNCGEDWTCKDTGFWFRDLFVTKSGRILCSDYERKFLISTDNGDSWRSKGRIDVHSYKSNEMGEIYLLTRGGDLLFSSDEGENWENLRRAPYIQGVGGFDIDKDENIYIATYNEGLIYSTDHGGIWEIIGEADIGRSFSDVTCPVAGTILAVARSGELYISTNKGSNWEMVNVPWTILNGFSKTRNKTFISTFEGLYEFNIEDYSLKHTGIPSGYIDKINIRDNNIYSVSGRGDIQVSTDFGESWTSFFIKQPYSHSIAINSNYEVFVYYESDGLNKTCNLGKDWEFVGFKETAVSSIAIDDKDQIFLGGKGILHFSKNNGETWEHISEGLPMTSINNIVFSNFGDVYLLTNAALYKTNDLVNIKYVGLVYEKINDVYCDKSGLIYSGTESGKVYLSTDNGNEWNEIMSNMDYVPVNAINKNREGYLLVGTSKGLYATDNNGGDWLPHMDGLISEDIRSIELDSKGRVFIATSESGVYRESSVVSSINEDRNSEKSYINLFQNYPNPANSSTIISFNLVKESFLDLEIYDIKGQLVENVISNRLGTGKHTVSIDASNYSSGIYFYRIHTNERMITKKMIILK